MSTASPYRLVRTAPAPATRLVPDEAQQAVLDHPGGPLLVLAGPGTGKTTTLVEAVARKVEGGLSADQVLVLTFSRKAAGELRERITARLGTPTAGPSAWTFHAFCYALVREHQPTGLYSDPLRLLSGPEQDVALRELLRGSLDLGRQWPPTLRAALTTRGLAEEVRALLSRAREVGLDPDQLGALAAREGRADWAALAGFFGEYLDVLDAQGAVDYAELVHRAVLLAEQPAVGEELRRRFRAVFVDEYQDTDPAQERLLQALAGGGRDLVVVGDPDQAIYAFRGAEVSGLLEFPDRFRTATGDPAPVRALTTCRRSGSQLLEVSRRVAARIPAPGLPTDQLRAHRALQPGRGTQAGAVEVHTHPSVGAEADAIADLLRREHLERGTPWSRMAVLVRSGARSVPLLRRVLTAAGVPLEVAGDEVPLAQEPAVAPLLLALRVVADPDSLTAEGARQLLLSPLGGADPGALRRLGRDLRALD
ncbi:MAG: ATP-dependent helicase, partial [Mycobacteriales bacterium]